MGFNGSMGTCESFSIKINLHFWNCAGQPLFCMHVRLITIACVPVTLFSEKVQACSTYSHLISSDSRLLTQRTMRLVWHLLVTVRSPVPSGIPGGDVGL